MSRTISHQRVAAGGVVRTGTVELEFIGSKQCLQPPARCLEICASDEGRLELGARTTEVRGLPSNNATRCARVSGRQLCRIGRRQSLRDRLASARCY